MSRLCNSPKYRRKIHFCCHFVCCHLKKVLSSGTTLCFRVYRYSVLPFTIAMGKKGVTQRKKVAGTGVRQADLDAQFKHDYTKDKPDPDWPYNHGKLDRGGKFLIILFPILIICGISYVYYHAQLKERVRLPLDAPKIISSNAVSAAEDPERFWGTYRSQLYFGMKARSPRSPVFGLMWMAQFTGDQPRIRHWCDQGDGIPMYGWIVHDGVNFGIQEVIDGYYTVSTDFVKRPGGKHGGDWSARIRVNPRKGAEDAVMSLFFYTALDGQGTMLHDVKGSRLLSVQGHSEELGNFTVKFPRSSKEGTTTKHNYIAMTSDGLDRLKERMISGMKLFYWDKERKYQYVGLDGNRLARGEKPDFIVHQVTTTLPYEMEVLFESDSFNDRPNELKGSVYQNEIQKNLALFEDKFEKLFGLQSKAFDEITIGFAKATLSNMLGSIGYFTGRSLVRSKYTDKEPLEYWNASLYSGIPSRSFFPRGFLWDEGFHNLLIQKWNQVVSMDIIGHWLDLLNIEGWIPREQILGPEARAKVPAEFIVQHNENANPPTLFLPLQTIVKNLIQSSDPKHRRYLENLFPRLKTWYNWFNTTQTGPVPGSYRWRGRDFFSTKEINPKTLSSGLDDYPRASHPTEYERHLDLRCWMALMSKVMANIAKSINQPWKEYEATYAMLTDNKLLDKHHWSEEKQRYVDFGLHTDHVVLQRPKPKPVSPGQRPPPPGEKMRVVKKEPVYRYIDSHFGYVSLFPFLIKIVDPQSLKLGKILSDIQDPNLLWTKYGLRSLAKNSPLYNKHNTEHDPPYWRGAIWMNINYLTLGALHHYSRVEGAYQEKAGDIYKQLRENIIENMLEQYKGTGYVWENYDDVTGKGKGTHPFTGWSALVVAIMAEEY